MDWILNRMLYPVYNLGPGKRMAIWTQGCPLQCKGCLSANLQDIDKGKAISIEKLSSEIVNISKQFQGITITGGEPFYQYNSLKTFCQMIKRLTTLDILIYSGYTLQELSNQLPDSNFYHWIDFLIDGRYEIEKGTDEGLRGSENQTMYQFINNTPKKVTLTTNKDSWSIAVTGEQDIYLSGVPAPGELKKMETALKKKGLELKFQ